MPLDIVALVPLVSQPRIREHSVGLSGNYLAKWLSIITIIAKSKIKPA
jgi:hypothetical protein